MKKILVTSSLMYDFIMDFPGKYEDQILPDKLKTLSITFQIDHLSKNFGGNGGNMAYTLSLLNVPTTLMTSLGTNDAEPFLEHLRENNVNTKYINLVENEFTGNCFIMTDSVHNQITGYYPGALREDSNLSITNIKDLDMHELMIISTSTPPAQMNYILQAISNNKPYLYAPGQEIARLNGEQLKIGIAHAKIIVVNDYELAMVLKKTGLSKNDLLNHAQVLITTLGPQGSLIQTKKQEIQVGVAKSDKSIDPTGAGDAYIAGFAAGYIRKLPLKVCGQMGALAATCVIEHYGTQKHKFSLHEFEKRYEESFQESLSL